MIKICYILTAFGGGADKHLLGILSHLDRKHFSATLICDTRHASLNPESELFKFQDVPTIRLHIVGAYNLKCVLPLYRFLKKHKYDIVHTHTPKADVVGSFSAFLARVPIRLSTVHGFSNREFSAKGRARWNAYLYLILLQIAYRLNTGLICVSNALRKSIVSKWMLRNKPVEMIYNGHDPSTIIDLSVELPERIIEHPIIAYDGRISPEKGFHFLVRAVNILKLKRVDISVLALGKFDDKKYQQEIENMIRNLGLDHQFYFAGFVNTVYPWLRRSTMLVIPSLTEACPVALLDGWNCKLPIIASNVGGIPELITNGSNGLLINPGSDEDIADKIGYLLHNPEEGKRLGQAGYVTLMEKFTINQMVSKTSAFYMRLFRNHTQKD